MPQKIYDAIVVGSGANGGWAAKQLCEAGMEVAMLEAVQARHLVDQLDLRFAVGDTLFEGGDRLVEAVAVMWIFEGEGKFIQSIRAAADFAGEDKSTRRGQTQVKVLLARHLRLLLADKDRLNVPRGKAPVAVIFQAVAVDEIGDQERSRG